MDRSFHSHILHGWMESSLGICSEEKSQQAAFVNDVKTSKEWSMQETLLPRRLILPKWDAFHKDISHHLVLLNYAPAISRSSASFCQCNALLLTSNQQQMQRTKFPAYVTMRKKSCIQLHKRMSAR